MSLTRHAGGLVSSAQDAHETSVLLLERVRLRAKLLRSRCPRSSSSKAMKPLEL